MGEYLTEKRIYDLLEIIFPDEIPVRDKAFPGYRFRPDYRFEKYKVIVEFDGLFHYTKAESICKDKQKDEILKSFGYKVIRIPYFVQFDPRTIKILFGIDLEYSNNYPHGFIDDKAVLPADFCSLGVQKFQNDLEKFSCIKDEILDSLEIKIRSGIDELSVVPINFGPWLDYKKNL